MNTTALPVRPDVVAFVARVRECLADLTEDERLELTEGLEADLTDQVAEHDGGVLGDPEAYARELRAAAGLEAAPRRRLRVPSARSLPEHLESARAWWDARVSHPRVAPVWSLLVALRPAWWVLRAWVAAVVLARLVPGWYDDGLAWLPGVQPPIALVLLAGCIAGSALVGMGRIWPGASPTGARWWAARLVLILLNVGAVIAVPLLNGELDQQAWSRYEDGYSDAYRDRVNGGEGVVNRGNEVCNIAAYDAAGEPLTGVQLFDQAGRPIDVQCYGQENRTVPWMLGDVTRWNVFPLGERARPARTPERRADLTGAAFPTPDRATTPEVTHPLVPPPVVPTRQDKDDDTRKKKGERARR